MDLDSISKIVWKRLVENVHQIQQKVQKENTKIIKLSLHQDSALWEQKENLATAKAAQERQQQNMLQLQMDIEDMSSKYQEELNKRPDIINKEETEEKLKSLAETIEAKCNEIEVHSSAAMQANKEFQLEKQENAKLVVELQNITASLEERGRELEVKTSALIEEKEARAKIESDLVNQEREFENELNTLREQQKNKVFQLEAGMRAKEEEHSRELADVLKKKTELLRPLPTPATEKRYFAWASQMRSSREASPTPAAIQRARDAPFTALQAQSQADEPASSAVPPPAKRARPGTPVRRAVRQNGTTASNAAPAGSKTTTKERRFFKSKGSKKSK